MIDFDLVLKEHVKRTKIENIFLYRCIKQHVPDSILRHMAINCIY